MGEVRQAAQVQAGDQGGRGPGEGVKLVSDGRGKIEKQKKKN